MAGIGIADISELALCCIHDLYVVLLYLCTAVHSLPTLLEDCSIRHYHYYYLRKFISFLLHFIVAQQEK
jgi:hypothetical protein